MENFQGGVHVEREGDTLPYASLPLTVPGLYLFTMNQRSSKEHVSLSSVNCSSKLIKPKEGVT